MPKISHRFIVNENGKKTGIILSVKEYRDLLEDLHDLAVIAERRKEPTISFKTLKAKLKKDGVL
ncbi:hypothetical protein DRP53_10495 [candidate division WOR-3 bacterium]|uniref:Type II toxin-antitoxin system Phd/YefM family antitoxin n=1 Tax=candidate division WOR-3 bacterium TaxID=2052148 RepID=A0A660SEC5_UNCW3|nr:MAG: hypothetical protein DRP53_10495 [candidate division WOR-3 bacterium]